MQEMEIIHQAGNVSYALLVSPKAIDNLQIDVGTGSREGFIYFHQKFGMPYEFLLKKSIESGHFLFVSIFGNNKLIGFARFEKLEQHTERSIKSKKNIVSPALFLLRSMEVNSSFRNSGIGRILFSTAVYHLQGNVLTIPDNPDAACFFRKKLGFTDVSDSISGYGQKYEGYLMLAYPKAVALWHEMAKLYPRMVYPELIDLYESLKFRHSMGKIIPFGDLERFELLLMGCDGMISNLMEKEMNSLLAELRRGL